MEYVSCFSCKGGIFEMNYGLASNVSPPCVLVKRRKKWEPASLVHSGSHGLFLVCRLRSFEHSIGKRITGQQNVRFVSECRLFYKPRCCDRVRGNKLSSTCNVLVGLVSELRQGTAGGDYKLGEPKSKDLLYEFSDKKVSVIEEVNVRGTNDLDEEEAGFFENFNDGRGLNEVNSTRVDVQALAWSLRLAKTADEVEEVLKDNDGLPLPVFSSIIKGFGIEKNLDPAFAIVEWLKIKKLTKGEIGPNIFIYNSLLGAVKQNKQFGLVDKIMEDMNADGVELNIVTYNTLMSIYLEKEEPEKALNIFLEIPGKGFLPSPVSYSTVLLAYRRMEDGQGALQFFVETREKYQKGDIGKDHDEDWENEIVSLENFTIRICYQVMRGWLLQGDHLTTKIMKLLGDMDKAGLQPDQSDYEKLVWACTIEGHYAVARELYTRIREQKSSDVSLSVCNHLIWLMGKAKKWWAALEIYEDLLDKGPQPNNLSYELILSHFNILLTAAKKRGIWRWGVRLLNKMQDKGLKPGSREWNAVLVACSKASETAAAVQIFSRMVEQGEKPTVISYGALLSALEKGKLYDEALSVWEHMCKVGLEPNLYAYTIILSVYIGRGQQDLIDTVISQMTSQGIEPTVVTFNAIITGFTKKGEGGTAFEWFNRMKLENITPNEITYEMVIEALARDGKPRLAFDMYLRAQKEGLLLSPKAYDFVLLSASSYGASIDISTLGPRPLEKKKVIKTRKILSEFCNLADVPRKSQPFDRKEEIYPSQIEKSVN